MELGLSTSSNDVFLYPSAALENAESAPDPTRTFSTWPGGAASGNLSSMVVANVKLTVPEKHSMTPVMTRKKDKDKNPDRIVALTLVVQSAESMAFPSGFYESNHPFHDKLTVDAAAGFPIHPGGEYHWDIPILLPCNAAPYERGKHARNYWTITAKMQLPGLLLTKTLTSEKNLFVVSAPQDQTVLSYDHIHSGFAEGLGQIQLAFISRSFTVGGYLRGAVLLPAPAPTLKIHAITMALVQTVTLQSRKQTSAEAHTETCPPDRYEFFTLRGPELDAQLAHTAALCRPRPAREGEIEIEWISRLPRDDQARPTTLHGSNARIRLSHQLEFSLLYDIDEQNPVKDENGCPLRKRYRTTWPVTITSCALRWRSLVLPEYSTIDENPVPSKDRNVWCGRTEHETHDHCNCGESLADVLIYEDEAEAHQNCTSDLLRQQLTTERSSRTRYGRSARPGGTTSRSRSRAPRSSTATPTTRDRDRDRESARHASVDRLGRTMASIGLGLGEGAAPRSQSVSASASASAGTSANASRTGSQSTSRATSRATSRSATPRTPRSRSRAHTPDRVSLDFEREEYFDSDEYDEGEGEGEGEAHAEDEARLAGRGGGGDDSEERGRLRAPAHGQGTIRRPSRVTWGEDVVSRSRSRSRERPSQSESQSTLRSRSPLGGDAEAAYDDPDGHAHAHSDERLRTYEECVDGIEYSDEDGEGGADDWDDDELMDKLERERQKRLQLYTTQVQDYGYEQRWGPREGKRGGEERAGPSARR